MNLQSKIVVAAQVIMNISKNFNSLSKKRALSNQSWNGEESKKVRECSLNDSSASLDDLFTEGLKSPECLHILVNCMKNIDAKIKEICEMNQVTQDNQIKGECQLRDLVKSIEFYNEKFDKLGRDNRKLSHFLITLAPLRNTSKIPHFVITIASHCNII